MVVLMVGGGLESRAEFRVSDKYQALRVRAVEQRKRVEMEDVTATLCVRGRERG